MWIQKRDARFPYYSSCGCRAWLSCDFVILLWVHSSYDAFAWVVLKACVGDDGRENSGDVAVSLSVH